LQEKNFGSANAALLIAAGGITNTLGRVIGTVFLAVIQW
jgi:hypothetical protein